MANDLIVTVTPMKLKEGEYWWNRDPRDTEFRLELAKEDDPLDGERGSIAYRTVEMDFALRWIVRWSILGRHGAKYVTGDEDGLLRAVLDPVFTKGFYDLRIAEAKGKRKVATPA